MTIAAYTAAICRRCRQPMKLARTIPKIGMLPELLVFHCVACDEIETEENKTGGVGPASVGGLV
jgi:hypothetical protein